MRTEAVGGTKAEGPYQPLAVAKSGRDASRAPSRRFQHGREQVASPTPATTSEASTLQGMQSSASRLASTPMNSAPLRSGGGDILLAACSKFNLQTPEELQDFLASLILSECVYKKLEMSEDSLARTMSAFASQFPPGWLQLEHIQLSLDDTPQHYLVATGGNSMYVAFMGTKQARDLVTDASVLHEPVWAEAVALAEDKKAIPAAHSGFLSRARSIQVEHLYDLAAAQGRKLVLCGHSLGGAVAKLCTLRLLRELPEWPTPPALRCYCFATPAIGNAALAELVASAGWAAYFKTYYLPEDQLMRLVALAQPQRRSSATGAYAATAAATAVAAAASSPSDSDLILATSMPGNTTDATLTTMTRTVSAPIPIQHASLSRSGRTSSDSMRTGSPIGGASPATPSPATSPMGPLSPATSLGTAIGSLRERLRRPDVTKVTSAAVTLAQGVLPLASAGVPRRASASGEEAAEHENDVDSLSDEEAAAVEEILAPPSSLPTSSSPRDGSQVSAAHLSVPLPTTYTSASAEQPRSSLTSLSYPTDSSAASVSGVASSRARHLPTNMGLALALQRKRVSRHLRHLAHRANLPLPLLDVAAAATSYHAFGDQRFILTSGVVGVGQDGLPTPTAPTTAPGIPTFLGSASSGPAACSMAASGFTGSSSSSSRGPMGGPLSWLPWRSPPRSTHKPAAAVPTATATSRASTSSQPSISSLASVDVSLEPPRGLFSHHRMLAYRCRVLHVIRDMQDALLRVSPELFDGLPSSSDSDLAQCAVRVRHDLVPRMGITRAVARPPLSLATSTVVPAASPMATAQPAVPGWNGPGPKPTGIKDGVSVTVRVSGTHLRFCRSVSCRLLGWPAGAGPANGTTAGMGMYAELMAVEDPVSSAALAWLSGAGGPGPQRVGQPLQGQVACDSQGSSGRRAPQWNGPLQQLAGVMNYLWVHSPFPGAAHTAEEQEQHGSGSQVTVRLTLPRAALDVLTASSSGSRAQCTGQHTHGHVSQSSAPVEPVRLELTFRSDFQEVVTPVTLEPYRVGVFGLSQRASQLLQSALAATSGGQDTAADAATAAATSAAARRGLWPQWRALGAWKAARSMRQAAPNSSPPVPVVDTPTALVQQAVPTASMDPQDKPIAPSVRAAGWARPLLHGRGALTGTWLAGPVRLLAYATGPWPFRMPRPMPPPDTAPVAAQLPDARAVPPKSVAGMADGAQVPVEASLGQQLRAAAVAAAAASAAVTSVAHVPALADVGAHGTQAAAVAAALAAAAARAGAVPSVMAAPMALGLTSTPAPSPLASEPEPATSLPLPTKATGSAATLRQRASPANNILPALDTGRLRWGKRSSASQQVLEAVVQPLDVQPSNTAEAAAAAVTAMRPTVLAPQSAVSGRPRWRLWNSAESVAAGSKPGMLAAAAQPQATAGVVASGSPEVRRVGWRLADALAAVRGLPPGTKAVRPASEAAAQPSQAQGHSMALEQHTAVLGSGTLLLTDLNAAAPRARAHPLALLRSLATSLWQQRVDQQPAGWRWWVLSSATQLKPRAAVMRMLRARRPVAPQAAGELPAVQATPSSGSSTSASITATSDALAAVAPPLDALVITANAEEPRSLHVLNSRAFAMVKARAAQAQVTVQPVLLVATDTAAPRAAAAAEALARACGVHVAEVQTVIVQHRQLLLRTGQEVAAARWLAALGGRALPYLPLWAQDAAAARIAGAEGVAAGGTDGEDTVSSPGAVGVGAVQGAREVVEVLVRVLEGHQNVKRAGGGSAKVEGLARAGSTAAAVPMQRSKL